MKEEGKGRVDEYCYVYDGVVCSERGEEMMCARGEFYMADHKV